MKEIGLAAMLATKRSAVVAPDVNLRECVICMLLLNVNKAVHSGFEPKGEITRIPKWGYQWPHKKDLCSPKNIS